MPSEIACTMPEYLARRDDPVTSHVAAEKAVSFIASHQAKIFAVLGMAIANTGMTYREIAHHADLEPVTVARRLKAMERKRLIFREALTDCSGFSSRDGMCLWFKS